MRDITIGGQKLLEAVGINPVVIHGGGKAISQRMRDAGVVVLDVAPELRSAPA